jgi:hypothetical protein
VATSTSAGNSTIQRAPASTHRHGMAMVYRRASGRGGIVSEEPQALGKSFA